MKIPYFVLLFCILFASCREERFDISLPPPSAGNQIQLSGIAGTEPGSAAANSVYVDFSTNDQFSISRSSWDLAFYCGVENRVMLNATNVVTAIITDKTDLSQVGTHDTVGKQLFLSSYPAIRDLELVDDLDGDLDLTRIPEIQDKDAPSPVIIINTGPKNNTQGAIIKAQIYRSGSEGYTIVYAELSENTTKTTTINKDSDYNFKFFDFSDGEVSVEPKSSNWDIVWTRSLYLTLLPGAGDVPYMFSDMVAINNLGGIRVSEKTFDTQEERDTYYEEYTAEDLASETFSTDKWYIGSNWRHTAIPGSTEPVGTYKNKFYIIKDLIGNAYKLQFISFSEEDGGIRGRPEIKYSLIL